MLGELGPVEVAGPRSLLKAMAECSSMERVCVKSEPAALKITLSRAGKTDQFCEIFFLVLSSFLKFLCQYFLLTRSLLCICN